ncbi:hypothetical protein SAMN05421788_10297 [Filimonas lacunae]|uniref:Uncharacterized protein n=1 Tax=Filimonas lacunae TaxID=477680 RepID=A0A173MIF5_9BACT|nr:hypothetical protein [Filimonas lacunae]BAV07279.1 hypothetical protein FLA_3302 [Filimonas lacunae]SIS92111.1 hypothetical protein SAMN05421788_10297 [Filimonas lacunae]
MRNELELLELIERYLAGQLGTAEKAAFEAAVRNNPQWQSELLLQQELRMGLERAMLKEEVLAAGARFHQGKGCRRWWFIGILLTALSLLVLLWVFYESPDAPNASQKVLVTDTLPAIAHADSLRADSLPLPARVVYAGIGNGDTTCCKEVVYQNTLVDLVIKDTVSVHWVNADSSLAAQVFWVNTQRDTVLETRDGILLTLPAYSFIHRDGVIANGVVEVWIKEALDAATIMLAGLNTLSGTELLESGGMFSVDARQNGEALLLNAQKMVLVQVPANEIKPGMQLFTGRRMPDGGINWENPRPLENRLPTDNIHNLQFYPPHYLDSVNAWGGNAKDKMYTDSLFFSQAAIVNGNKGWALGTDNERGKSRINPNDLIIERQDVGRRYTNEILRWYTDTTWAIGLRLVINYYASDSLDCMIDPARIKVIWSDDFQQTLLATRAFEERLAWIYQTHDNAVLDLYVNNLDKDLYVLDSMAAALVSGSNRQQFLTFAAKHEGGVPVDAGRLQELQHLYKVQPDVFRQKMKVIQQQFWARQEEQDKLVHMKKVDRANKRKVRAYNNPQEEMDVNFNSVYEQMGVQMSNVNVKNTTVVYKRKYKQRYPAAYTGRITQTGWHNIDRYVANSVINRTSFQYTDAYTGKKAAIRYSPASFTVKDAAAYDRVLVYLLPDKLSSCMRLVDSAGVFKEQLNDLIHYHLVCLGFKGEQVFVHTQRNIAAGQHAAIELASMGKMQLVQELNELGSLQKAVEIQDDIQLNIRNWWKERHDFLVDPLRALRIKMVTFLMPCAGRMDIIPVMKSKAFPF